MDSVNCNEVKLKNLLSRFVNSNILKPEVLRISYNYLFGQDYTLPLFMNDELYDTIIYLKDLIEINELNDLDDVINHYSKKKKKLEIFIKDSNEVNRLPNSFFAFNSLSHEINWHKIHVDESKIYPLPVSTQTSYLCCAITTRFPRSAHWGLTINSCIHQKKQAPDYEENDFNYLERADALPEERKMTEV
jgi:hypothetical protein